EPHSPPSVHTAPFGFLPGVHMCMSLQNWPVGQAGSPKPVCSNPQAPGTAPLQVEQTPVHALTQQTPSTQKPEPHSDAALHLSRFGLLPIWQVPAASQYWLPLQSGDEFPSCDPAGRLTQAPSDPGTAHDWQTLVQALTQQTPSTQ